MPHQLSGWSPAAIGPTGFRYVRLSKLIASIAPPKRSRPRYAAAGFLSHCECFWRGADQNSKKTGDDDVNAG
jgi:hypothetical protein